MQFRQIYVGPLLTLELHHGGEDSVGRTGALRAGHLDRSLVLRLGQVFPGTGHGEVLFLENVGVHRVTENTGIHTGAVMLLAGGRVLEFLANLF